MREFRILGPLEVLLDGKPVGLGGPKQRATLAILLLNANRVVSIDRLADDLYAGSPPVTAVTQVQRQISELRKVLGSGSVIETRAPGYVVNVAPEELDLTRFERLTEDARHARERGDASPTSCRARRSSCGGANRWRISPGSRSPWRRCGGWRSSAWRRWSSASTAISRSDGTAS